MRVDPDWAKARGRADRVVKALTVPAYVFMVLAVVSGFSSCSEKTQPAPTTLATPAIKQPAPTTLATPAIKQPAPTTLATPTLLNWVEIPAGDFRMGAQGRGPAQPNYDPWAYNTESPVHLVRLSAYRIGKFPVTVAEFQRFVDAGGYTNEAYWQAGGFTLHREPKEWASQLENPDRPVGVSWYEASAYAAWANCRLPTEAEWERAARGTVARKYPWGNDPPNPSLLNFDDSNIGDSNIGHATPVGAYPGGATPEGVCDMGGNVWEWCQDWDGRYKADDQVDPRGPAEGQLRVLRGGWWGGSADTCRSSYRSGSEPGSRNPSFGFRVVSGAP